MSDAKQLDKEYALLSPAGKAEVWSAADFWKMATDAQHPKNTNDMGYLVSSYDFDKDWQHWEKHPNGDELVMCLSGTFTFSIREGQECQQVVVTPGAYVVIPKDTWHTAKVPEPAKALSITWGHGTQHRSVDCTDPW